MAEFVGGVLGIQPGGAYCFLDDVFHRAGGQTGPVPGDEEGVSVAGLLLGFLPDGEVGMDGLQAGFVQVDLPLLVAFP